MKKLFSIIAIILLFSFVAQATTPTVTITRKAYGGMSAYSWSFTTSAIGTGDTAVIAPSAGYFNTDEYNNQDMVISYLSTGETTVDSVRFDIVWQGKATPNGTWRTLETVTADSTLTKVDVFTQNTYGRWPIMRILILSGDAKTSVQTLTGEVLFKKD